MFADRLTGLIDTRLRRPQAVAEAAATRIRPSGLLGERGRLMVVAADHPARGALRAGTRPMAMADRGDLLERLCAALDRPGVDGVLGTADILEDLLLLGALDGKLVFGSMNRGGLAGTTFEIDDRFTGYDAATVARMGFEGGKMLLRVDPERPGHRTDPGSLRQRRHRTRRAATGRDGRAVHLAPRRRPGPQRPDARGDDPRDRCGGGTGRHVGVHLAEGARRRVDGAGDGGLDDARVATGWRSCCRPGGRFRIVAEGTSTAHRQRAWSWAARCSTRPMTTWPVPSTPP